MVLPVQQLQLNLAILVLLNVVLRKAGASGGLRYCKRSPAFLHCSQGSISIADACNLAVLEEMVRDPTTVMHAEDLQVRSSARLTSLRREHE